MSANTPERAVEASNISKIYGSGNTEVKAMVNVSFTISKGEVVGLLGPSGSGKSTLLTAIGLINPPTSGQIRIGKDLVTDGPSAMADVRKFRRKHIGYVFQKANLIPFLTALENVQIALEINDVHHKEARKRAIALFEYLGIEERKDNLPHQLSGGQQQRVAVARSLANKPGLILADEPTAALDSFRGRQVMELFQKVAHEQGAGVLVVTHDHRTFEMEDGTLKLKS
jgi:putative ABC transport system ATP-binding protein